jgi:DNA-binding transcriptional LysR family regulator
MIDVQRLVVLREVARAGSFAGAASALYHTPSAVSQQIAALERSAGAPLVERSTRGVTLTQAGLVLLAAADAVHAELRAAEQQLRELQASGPRTLTVATFPSAGEPLLVPALTQLAAARPDVEVTVVEAEPDDALAHLRAGGADLALVYHFHTRRPPGHWSTTAGPGTYSPLLDDHLRLLVPTTHRLAGRSAVALSDLAEDRWVQGWGDTGAVLDALAAAGGFRPDIACRSSDYRFMAALVSAGVGVALIPRLALADSPGARALSVNPQPTRYVGAYQTRRRWTHPAADLLLTALHRQAASLGNDRAATWHGAEPV